MRFVFRAMLRDRITELRGPFPQLASVRGLAQGTPITGTAFNHSGCLGRRTAIGHSGVPKHRLLTTEEITGGSKIDEITRHRSRVFVPVFRRCRESTVNAFFGNGTRNPAIRARNNLFGAPAVVGLFFGLAYQNDLKGPTRASRFGTVRKYSPFHERLPCA